MPGAPWKWWLLKPHGTEAAARRHRRAGQKPCPPCLAAESLAWHVREEIKKRNAKVADHDFAK